MATTYTEIATETLSSAQASFTFSSIPSTYTDLVIVSSLANNNFDSLYFKINGDTGSNYSSIYMTGNGTTATSAKQVLNTTGIFAGAAAIGLSSTVYGVSTIEIMNYANTNTLKTSLSRWSLGNSEVNSSVGLWNSTAAINSVTVLVPSGTLSAGSTLSLYGIANAINAGGPKATGGDTVSTDGTYWYHAFRASGTFTPLSTLSCDVLAIAGGGSGGNSNNIFNTAGGGGAGGVYYSTGNSVGSAQTVTVGAGASGAAAGIQGSNSVFGSLTAAVGGGGGGNYASGSVTGGNGGSGGGGSSLGNYAGGSATSGQGFAGGNGTTSRTGAGGGGAGAVGQNSPAEPNAGNGGAGTNTYSSWLSTTGTGVSGYIAGGGGGGNSPAYGTPTGGVGGSGGGGSSSATSGTVGGSGVANTGGGGAGGTGNGGSPYYGGNGGSGLVIVRYAV